MHMDASEKELKAFSKIELAPGEKQQIVFELEETLPITTPNITAG